MATRKSRFYIEPTEYTLIVHLAEKTISDTFSTDAVFADGAIRDYCDKMYPGWTKIETSWFSTHPDVNRVVHGFIF